MSRNEAFAFRYDLRMAAESEEAEILLYGEIVQYKYREDDPDMTARDFDKLLKEAKASGAKKLRLRINSPGGSVWQAVAMRSMLMNSAFETIAIDIEGLCASAATLFTCLPGVHVRIAEGSEFMIHNPYVIAWGTASELESMAERMHKTETEQHALFAKRCGRTEQEIKDWMDAETWMTAREAVANGFCDEVLEAGEIAACVTPEAMRMMRQMYRHVPQEIGEKQSGSNAEPEVATGDAAEHKEQEDKQSMEIKDITEQQLREENAGVYDAVMQAGAAAERERISAIDDMTPAGYEQMAQEAKQNGTSAADYCKMIVKAQREKGAGYLASRQKETAPAEKIKGEASNDHKATEDDEMKAYAKEIAQYAKDMRMEATGGMY